MLNINELEQRWLRYKIKSYIPHAVIAFSIILILIFTLFYFNTNTIKHTDNSVATVIQKSAPTEPKIQVETSVLAPIQKKELYIEPRRESISSGNTNKMTISPSLDFIKKMQGNTLSNYEYKSSPTKKESLKPRVKVKREAAPVKKTVKAKPIVVPKVQPVKLEKKKVQINRQNTHDDISQVISRFNKNNNPALSLFIAKKYYELGEYHKAYNYALITNEINSEIEASWIIFSKSLVKLGKKDMAIQTLKKYISQSNSNRANILLDDIVSGKFK